MLTTDRQVERKENGVQHYKMGAVRIFAGALVGILRDDRDGLLYNLGDEDSGQYRPTLFCGIAAETKDNRSGADTSIRVYTEGTFLLGREGDGWNLNSIGSDVFGDTIDIWPTHSSGNPKVGQIVGFESEGAVWVKIDTTEVVPVYSFADLTSPATVGATYDQTEVNALQASIVDLVNRMNDLMLALERKNIAVKL